MLNPPKNSPIWLAALLFFACVGPAAAETRMVRVSLALFGDIYDLNEPNGRGGFARLAAAIKAERARGGHLIVAHAGDTISPSLYSGFDQGAHIIDLTNQIGPDLFVPGNHEFDFGENVFRKRMAEATFPVLAANLRDKDGQPLAGVRDTAIMSFDGVRIGFVGLTADDSTTKSSPGSLQFQSTVAVAKEKAAALRQSGADLVVAVIHADRRTDLRLYYSHAVDLVLSGDDHDLALLYDGRSVLAEAAADGAVLLVTDLEIEIDQRNERVVSWRPRFRIIDTADVAPDAAIATQVAAYNNEMAKELDVELGSLTAPLESTQAVVRAKEAAIGNLVADAMRDAVHADVAIINGGGIRGDRTYASGHRLLRRDVLTELPFPNKVVLVEMSGRDLKSALENGLTFAGKPNGRYPQVSGVQVVAEADAVPGKKIKSITVGGQPLKPDGLYRVATNDFIASGREGYDVFVAAKRIIAETDGPLVSNVVMSFIRTRGTVSAQVEGRLVLE